MAWMELFQELFTHRAQLCTTSLDAYGVSTITAVETLSCFCFEDNSNNVVTANDVTASYSVWKIVFESDDVYKIKLGSVLRNIKDEDEVEILPYARIASVSPYRHWEEGLQCVVANLELN